MNAAPPATASAHVLAKAAGQALRGLSVGERTMTWEDGQPLWHRTVVGDTGEWAVDYWADGTALYDYAMRCNCPGGKHGRVCCHIQRIRWAEGLGPMPSYAGLRELVAAPS